MPHLLYRNAGTRAATSGGVALVLLGIVVELMTQSRFNNGVLVRPVAIADPHGVAR